MEQRPKSPHAILRVFSYKKRRNPDKPGKLSSMFEVQSLPWIQVNVHSFTFNHHGFFMIYIMIDLTLGQTAHLKPLGTK
jgi:hypothetical protein